MKKILLAITLLIVSSFILSRCTYNSEYVENFDWMVKTFTENDAGFKFYLEEKGLDSYTKHTESYRDKIKNAKSEQEFLSLMNDWLYYFRKGHIGVVPKQIKSRYSHEE